MNANLIDSFGIDRQNEMLIRSMSIRAATYSRYSDDGQRETSIADQQRNCRHRADAEGWLIDVEHEFADYAISGSDSSRPQYQAMLRSARSGGFQVLLIDDLSRLARDSLEAERAIRSLEFHDIRIVSTSDGYDSMSKSRKITRGFKNLMNETFLDAWASYPILTMAELPELKVVIAARPEFGVYGQGSEGANALAASATAAAVFDATGKPVRRIPLKPDYVKAMLAS